MTLLCHGGDMEQCWLRIHLVWLESPPVPAPGPARLSPAPERCGGWELLLFHVLSRLQVELPGGAPL